MGFNFRKRIRIGKFLNLNIGKSGLSVSVGRKGIRQSFNTKGQSRTTLSIPGTGLSYSKTVNAKDLLKIFGPRKPFESPSGHLIPEEEVHEFKEDIEYITTLHHGYDIEKGIEWEEILEEKSPFSSPEEGPHVKQARQVIEENKPGLLKRIFAGGQFKKESSELLRSAEEEDRKILQKWTHMREIASDMVEKKDLSMVEILSKVEMQELMAYANDFQYALESDGILNVTFTIDSSSVIPKEYKMLTPTGKLSQRKYTKTDYYYIVNQFVSGLLLRTARNIFHLVSSEKVLLNIHDKQIDEVTGKESVVLILSALVDRETLSQLEYEKIDPFESLTNFRHEVKFLKTKGFQEVAKLS